MPFIMSLLKIFALAVLVVGMVISASSFYSGIDEETKQLFLDEISDDVLGSTWRLPLFFYSYQMITPSFYHEWYGDEQQQTWLLEQIPLPDSRDVLVLFFIAWLPLLFITKLVWASQKGFLLKLLLIVGLWVVITLIMWVIYKSVAYQLTYSIGEDLGVQRTTLDDVRKLEYERTDMYVGIGRVMLITLMFSVLLLYALIQGRKNNGSR